MLSNVKQDAYHFVYIIKTLCAQFYAEQKLICIDIFLLKLYVYTYIEIRQT
jgi:hypothetical protein